MSTQIEHIREVVINAKGVQLSGILTIPERPEGVVAFAHGSGSGRYSPRNQFVAAALQQHHLATLLFDLLSEREEALDAFTGHLRFNIPLLSSRLIRVCEWIACRQELSSLSLGLFGASTGAGAALIAAAQRPQLVKAVVSRGGRPDLAGDALPRVKAPTLLIVGAHDEVVIELNEKAMQAMTCPHEMVLVPNATHLFEEPGALEEVANLAVQWFHRHLTGVQPPQMMDAI
jgi:putative phosphoribosyl transferase